MRNVLGLVLVAMLGCGDDDPVGGNDAGVAADAGVVAVDAGDPCTDENMQTDPDNCGSCGNRCVYYGAEAACVEGACALAQCNEGYWDLNQDPADGCEYACVYGSVTPPFWYWPDWAT